MTSGSIFTIAILVGGQGRRLGGRDKSALEVGGRRILERQLGVACGLTPHVRLVTANDRWQYDLGVPVTRDRVAGAGALGGLYTALMEAPTDQLIALACDMPFLTAPFLQHLAVLGESVDALVPRDSGGVHPLCASYHRRIASHLKARIDAGALSLVDALRGVDMRELTADELAPYDPDGLLLLNVNTPEDYARARVAADERDQSPQKRTAVT